MDSMYEIIMDLPLFQGMSHEKVSELIEHTKFHFLKFRDGERVVSESEDCEFVRFVISGEVKVIYKVPGEGVTLSYCIGAPSVIGVEYLFGKDRKYPFSVVAWGECGVLQITKSDYVRILQTDNVFLFNLANILSHAYQRSANGVLVAGGSVAQRIAVDLSVLTPARSHDICYEFKQKAMCQRFGVQRSSFVNALDAMLGAGLVEYTASSIKVLNREAIISQM